MAFTTGSCLKSRPYFSQVLDGEAVPGGRGLVVRVHLAICPGCRAYFRSLQATCDALRALGEESPAHDDSSQR